MLLFLVLLFTGNVDTYAQNALQRRQGISRDSIIERQNQQRLKELEAPIDTTQLLVTQDSAQQELTIHKERFIPNPNRSVWLALVIPGGGQIYNRKYWKLPLVYGGFVGCAYALNWNSLMYKDYSQAYLDIMDDDPNKVVTAVKTSKKCMSIVYQNIYFSIGVKLLVLLLGALGIANMWFAVFADVGVMFIAVLNAVRAMKI